MSDRLRLIELLRERAVRRGRFVLSSGKESDFYLDTKQVTLHAEGLALVGRLFWQEIAALPEQPVAAGGLTLGADPLAAAVALASYAAGTPVDAFIVRKEAKGHGTGAFLEGTRALSAGAAVVVLEDVITTGASTLRAIERCRAAGLRVVGVVALIDREEDDGLGAVRRAAEAPVVAICTKTELL